MGNICEITVHGYGVAHFRNGGAFLFDAEDLPLIRAHTWHHGKRGYPATHIRGHTVVLHRLLFPEVPGEIDHINGDRLDNRRSNLRVVTHQQNAFNQKRRITNTSGFIGVSPRSSGNAFEAYIHYSGRKHHLGTFADPETAARTRDVAAKLVFGEYARLNFSGQPSADLKESELKIRRLKPEGTDAAFGRNPKGRQMHG